MNFQVTNMRVLNGSEFSLAIIYCSSATKHDWGYYEMRSRYGTMVVRYYRLYV